MEEEALKRIFGFLEKKGEYNTPLIFKLLLNITLTEEELNVKGNLRLPGRKITTLPEGLKIGGSLDLSYSNITSLLEQLF